MGKKTLKGRALKNLIKRSGKSGFTLVELSIVMALIAVLTASILTFTLLMDNFAKDSEAEYEFLEDHAKLKSEISAFVAEKDLSDNIFAVVGESGYLAIRSDSGETAVEFNDHILSLGEREIELSEIDIVIFSAREGLLKCTARKIGRDRQIMEAEFVVALRVAEITVEEGEAIE